MKITIYTTNDCQFSKSEKDYLASHKLPFEEKNLETNKEFLTEMLAISNNFAGTPVTRVEKDDGAIAVLKGFTKEEFDTTLGFTPTTPPVETGIKDVTKPSDVKPVQPVSTELKSETKPANAITTPPVPPVDQKLGSVLDKLEDKATSASAVQPPQPPMPEENGAAPAPNIPDFPAK